MGSLHTALFNWALARSLGGDFILRMDDTDATRSSEEFTQEMLGALAWLGLDWDEGPDIGGEFGPYRQSARRARHLEIARTLHRQGDAYYGDDPSQDAGPQVGAPLRLRLPDGDIIVHDALRGAIRFDEQGREDPVIVRSDGSPLYHLASVVDDYDMAITHVARGEDWLASTPIHVQLYRRLSWQMPVWVHLPLIRDSQGRKLSKRDDDGSYLAHDFQALGYLPQALFNYLLLLGWSPPDRREFLSKADVRRYLQLRDLSASPATFDWDKLNWINRRYLRQPSDAQLATMVRPFLEDVYSDRQVEDRWLERLVALIRDDMTRLSDVVDRSEWALSDTFAFSPDAERALEAAPTRPVLARLVAELAHVVLLDEHTARSILQSMQQAFADSFNWQAREVYWPIRAALTGRVRGPALHEMMALLGKGRCLERAAAILRTA